MSDLVILHLCPLPRKDNFRYVNKNAGKLCPVVSSIEENDMRMSVGHKDRSNRRALPRKPVMVLEVKGQQHDKIFLAYAEDLGLGGLRLASSPTLKIGDHFPVEFILPDQITKINCTGEVVWRRESGAHSEGVGVRFVDLSQQLKKVIGSWMDQEEKEKKSS